LCLPDPVPSASPLLSPPSPRAPLLPYPPLFRSRRGGVAGSCLVGGPQDVHSHLPAQILDAYAFLAHLRLLRTLPAPSGQRRATPRPTPYAGEQWSTTPKGPGVSEPRSLERR